MENKRIQFFDICKGILISFVVLGHIMPEKSSIHMWIYSWHMPAFFMISGMLMEYTEYDKRPLITRRGIIFEGLRKLIIPYFYYGMLLLLVRWMSTGFDSANLKWQLVDLGLFCGIGATWFLPCLFVAQVIYYLIKHCLICNKNNLLKSFVLFVNAVLLFAIPCVLGKQSAIMLVVLRAMIASVFCIIGASIVRWIFKLRNMEFGIQVIIALVLVGVSIFVFIFTGMNTASLNILNLGNPILYILNALVGCSMIFVICACLEKSNCKWCKKIFEFFGSETLIVMGTHQVFMILLGIPIKESVLLNMMFCVIIMVLEVPCIIFVRKMRSIIERIVVKENGK